MADSTFLSTTVFNTIEYTEIKAVCVTTIAAKPDASNVNTLVKAYTPANLADLSIIELEKKGGPSEGAFLVEGHSIKYGVSYERDDNGDIVRDEDGELVVLEDNGVLYGINVGEAHKKITFNAIVVYGTEINVETNAPVVAVVSMFNNSLSFEKILNFFARYIITVNKEIIEIVFDWINVYGEHEKQTNNSTYYMNEQHPQLLTRNMLSGQGDITSDELNKLQKQYELYIKDRDDYLYIKPVKDNKFDNDLLSTSIQAHQNARLYKYEDATIKTPYLYFYYNLVASRKIIIEGIKDAADNTEDKGAVEAITIEQLRKHIKIGFSETMGPFLYTWFSTTKFIYVICYGSNSNNNVDIYRVRNRNGYDINDVNYNLIVGRYLDRIYFTIDGDLHVCVPQVKTKTKETQSENVRFREEAAKSLTFNDFLYVDFDTIEDSEIEKAYATVFEDITQLNSADYLLQEEQLYILILSKNDEYKKFITDGKFVYPASETYTPPINYPDQTTPPTTAKEFFDWGLFQPDASGNSVVMIQDKKNVYQFLKYPMDRINQFKSYMDNLVKECISYKDNYGTESYKTPYVNQICIRLIERMNPDYPTDTNYNINWWGQNKNSGTKYNVLNAALKGNDETKYEGYIEKYLTETETNNIIDIILNVAEREKVETNLPVESDTFNVYMNGIVDRLSKKDPTYDTEKALVGFKEYYFKEIYKVDDIIATETALRRYYKYSLYRALFDNVVQSSKSYQQYVLREYLINEEKAGNNNGDLIDSFNSMTAAELDTYFEQNKLTPLLNSIYGDTWWNETTLESLEKIYYDVIFTPLYITYAFSSKDDCYYNGTQKTDVSIVSRDADIPYRYGFPLPDYIYNSQTYDGFIIAAKENVDIAGEYKSLSLMKEALMVAKKDGEAETKAELDALTTLTADIEVASDTDVYALTTIAGTLTELEKENLDKITVYAESTDVLPNVGATDTYYYIKMNNAVCTFNTTNQVYEQYCNYPSNGSIYQIGDIYYKAETTKQNVDYSVKVDNGSFDATGKQYKITLKNITKTDTVENVTTTNNSTDDKVEYVFTPPVAKKEYTLSFAEITPTEGDALTIIVTQGAKELLNQTITDETEFKITPTTKSNITVSIEKATTMNMTVSYISSGNTRKLTITETIEAADPDDAATVNNLIEEDLNFTAGDIAEKIITLTPTANSQVNISIEQGNIGSIDVTYQEELDKINKWTEYTLPAENTIAQAKDSKNYYKYDGTTWTQITLQEIRNKYTNKIYFVKGEDKYYKFSGMSWLATNPVYDITKDTVYRITNEDLTINDELAAVKTGDYIGTFSKIRANQLYNISITGISIIDDREIIDIPVDINIDKYEFTPVDINIEYSISFTGITGNGKIILKKDTQQLHEETITDLTDTVIKYTPTDTDKITIEIDGITCNTPTIQYIKNENSGLTRTINIKQNNVVLKTETITFTNITDTFDKEYEITSGDNENDIIIEIDKATVTEAKATYSYIRTPDGTGLEYYKWNGKDFEKTIVQIIAPQNSCNWYLEDIPVYFNIFIEGDKLNVIRDLFKGLDGETLKVVQFDFSDIGDVVLVRDYNKQGQNCWGGIFSRYATSTEVDTTQKVYNYGSVMSDNFTECFNWDAYNYIQFTVNAAGETVITDERVKAIQATYEVSRSHFEVLYRKFGDNMLFSNALTVAWEKSDTEPNYSHTMFIYPKNIKMFPNMTTIPYNGIRFLVNNYFIIEGVAWFDMIYNRYYKMDSGVQPLYYKNRFLGAMRSLVVVSVSDHDEENGTNGAVSYFNCNNWYDKTKVTDYIEKVNIPQKDI